MDSPPDFSLTETKTPAPAEPPPLLVRPLPAKPIFAEPAAVAKTPEIIIAPDVKSESVKKTRSYHKHSKVPENADPNKEHKNPLWHPTEEQFILIRQLAELGWSSPKIAEALEITSQQFAGAIIRYPRVKTEYDQGVENCKAFPERRLTWRPMPVDIAKVEELAATGLREIEIAAQLNVSRNSFLNRMSDTPQLKEAFELGEGRFRAKLMTDSQEMLDNRDPDLKFAAGLMIFKLKAHCGLNDKAEVKPLMVEGRIEHRHTLNAPKPVAIQDISAFAAEEMRRATQISAEKLKAAGVIEAEVVE